MSDGSWVLGIWSGDSDSDSFSGYDIIWWNVERNGGEKKERTTRRIGGSL